MIFAKEGSVTLEMALVTTLLVGVLWFGAEAARHSRLQNDVHRATATMADILANQKLQVGEFLTDRLEEVVPAAALTAFGEMVGLRPGEPDYEGSLPGLRVTYYDTATLDPVTSLPYEPESYQAGYPCAAPRDLAAMAPALTTTDNVAKTRLVMVESCLSVTPRSVGSLVFPSNLSSWFVTMVKKW
jgi:hypothetical protein